MTSAVPLSPGAPGGHPERPAVPVLVVAADEDMRAFLQALIEQDPCFALLAGVGAAAEATVIARRQQPSVVVLDVQCTGGEELDAVAALRQALPGARIVVCSLFPDAYTLVDLLLHGADEYIDSAVAWSELLPTLRGLCDLET